MNPQQETPGEKYITTQKDAVRFPKIHRRDLPIFLVRSKKIKIISGAKDFNDCVRQICFQGQPRRAG